ncbi:hypothetical protein Tco_0156981 [Tanacetum coccineum]
MDNTRAQQKALDDELVTPANRLKIGKSNLRLISNLKSKEPTLQVVLDALKLTLFYKAFEITADVPEIYMQEDMLKICPKLPGQIFKEPHLKRRFYLLLETLDTLIWWYQVENKNSKKNNDMYYLRFTKFIVDYFMAKDQAIPRRNKMFWHYARDDFMFTTIRVISKHQETQVYGAILPQHLTNQAMLESKAYMTYHAYATGEKTLKPKSTKKKVDSESSLKTKLTQASKGKKNQDAEQVKLATKRSLIQTHSSQASGSGADEGTGSIPGVPDVSTYESDDEQISWKSSEEEDDDEVNMSKDNDDDADNDDDVDKDDEDDDADNQDDEIPDDANQDDDDEQTDSDNDGDDFVHPKLSTHDDEARQDDEVNEEESDDESNEDSDEEVQGANIEEEEMDEEATHEEDEANELYRDVNINLEGRDTVMTDAPLPNVQGTQVTEDTHAIITAPLNPEGNSRVLLYHLASFLTCLTPVQIQFKQTNQFAEAVSSIPGIVDAYLANKMHEAIKTVDQVKEQVKAQVSKILPKIKKTVNEQLKAEVMTRSSTESKTSLALAANLSELELKKILIDKMESNKSIHRSDEQNNLYKALVNAYESDKLILDTYGDIVSFKRRRDDEDKDEEPSARSNRGSKRRRAGKEPESTSTPKEKTSKISGKSYEGSKSKHKTTSESAQTEEPMHTTKDLEEPAHQEFNTGVTKDQPNEETP